MKCFFSCLAVGSVYLYVLCVWRFMTLWHACSLVLTDCIISQWQMGFDHLWCVIYWQLKWQRWAVTHYLKYAYPKRYKSAALLSLFILAVLVHPLLNFTNITVVSLCLCVCVSRTLRLEHQCLWWTPQTRIRGRAAACSSPSSHPLRSSPSTGPEGPSPWPELWTMRSQPPISSRLMPRWEMKHSEALDCKSIVDVFFHFSTQMKLVCVFVSVCNRTRINVALSLVWLIWQLQSRMFRTWTPSSPTSHTALT